MKENNSQLRRHMRNQSQNWPEGNTSRFNNDRDFATRKGHRLNDGYNDDYRTHDNWEEEQDYYGNQYNNSAAFGQGSSSYGPDQYNEQGYENRGYGRPNRQNDEDMNYGSMNQNSRNNWEDRDHNDTRDQYNRGNKWANQWGNSYQDRGQDRNDQGRMGTTPGYDRQNQWQNNHPSFQWDNNERQQWGNNNQNQWNNDRNSQWGGNSQDQWQNNARNNQWGNNDRQQQWGNNRQDQRNDQGSSNQYRDQQYGQFQNKNGIGSSYATDRFSNRNSWENNANNNNSQYGNTSWNNGNNGNSERWGAMGGNNRSASWMNNDQDRSSMNEGNHRGKGPRGYQRSEDRIKEDIHDRLSDDSFLDASEIEVSMENNSVILSGSVESRTAKRRAEDIAESVSGVSNVENRLRVAEHQQQSSGAKTDAADKKQPETANKMNTAGTTTSASATTGTASPDHSDKSKPKTTA